MKRFVISSEQSNRIRAVLPSNTRISTEYEVPIDSIDGRVFDWLQTARLGVSDNHKFAFHFWWLFKHHLHCNFTKLIHVDRHLDNVRREIPLCRHLHEIDSIESSYRYADVYLSEGDFIVPAFEIGLFSSGLFVLPEDLDKKHRTDLGQSGVQNASVVYGLSHLESIKDKSECILDLDLDYFVLDDGEVARNSHAEIRYILSFEWAAITVSLSPVQCGGIDVSLRLLSSVLGQTS